LLDKKLTVLIKTYKSWQMGRGYFSTPAPRKMMRLLLQLRLRNTVFLLPPVCVCLLFFSQRCDLICIVLFVELEENSEKKFSWSGDSIFKALNKSLVYFKQSALLWVSPSALLKHTRFSFCEFLMRVSTNILFYRACQIFSRNFLHIAWFINFIFLTGSTGRLRIRSILLHIILQNALCAICSLKFRSHADTKEAI
jgi:hypothetical protein